MRNLSLEESKVVFRKLNLENYVPGYGFIKWGYFGMDDVGVIHPNSQSDVIIYYKSYLFNGESVLWTFLDTYREEYPEDIDEAGFGVWMKENASDLREYLEELIGIGCYMDTFERIKI